MSEARLGHGLMDGSLRVALISQSEFGVAVCDAEGMLVETNPTLESMLDVPYVPTGPRKWSGRYHLFDQDGRRPLRPEELPLVRALHGKAVVDEVICARPPDQPLRYLRCNGARLFGSDGRMAGAVVFVADVTSQVTRHKELDALRDQLIETVNHELRTPVAILKGHVELLQEAHQQLPTAAQWSLDAIGKSLARLERVLESIRDLANRATIPRP